jgi:spermidine/putrescine-binding protein
MGSVRKILDNTVLSNSSGAVSKFVNDGEAAIGLSNEDTLLKFKAGGGPVEIVYPADGTSALADSMALSATPGNPKGARRSSTSCCRVRRRRFSMASGGAQCVLTWSPKMHSRR